MAMGSPLRPRMQLPSHCVSWGQTRPQTAGSDESWAMMSAAREKSSWATAAMNSGILMLTGQLETHMGFLQWRQRRASATACSRVNPKETSSKLAARTAGSCSRGFCLPGAGEPPVVIFSASSTASARLHLWSWETVAMRYFWSSGRRRRLAASSKSTRWPSNSGPSTQVNLTLSPTVTRQAPHMPVPSTIMQFMLTMVLRPRFLVRRETNFIMGRGPMAMQCVYCLPESTRDCILFVTRPFSP